MPFKKAPKKGVVEIKGLKTSPNHLVKCASTGVPSIDTLLLGGGLPVGYILSVVADEPRIYSYILHKFFSSEGIEAENVIFVAGKGSKSFFTDLPTSTDQQEKAQVQDEKLKIAWAYQNKKAELNGPELRVPPVGLGGPGGTSRYGHYWDIAAPRDVNQIKCPIISIEPTDYNGSKEFCSAILNQLEAVIKEHAETKLIRINFLDFGDILWPKGVELFQFLMKLRKLTSDRNVVTFITVPRTMETAICQFSDAQFKMSNFVVNQSHFKSIYDGIIDLTKMVQVGLRPFQPKTSSFGFKLKRKKFYIESLHLPPDFEEDKIEKTTGCGTPAPSSGGSAAGGGCCGSSGSCESGGKSSVTEKISNSNIDF